MNWLWRASRIKCHEIEHPQRHLAIAKLKPIPPRLTNLSNVTLMSCSKQRRKSQMRMLKDVWSNERHFNDDKDDVTARHEHKLQTVGVLLYTYISLRGNFGMKIDTSDSWVSKSQDPPRPYFPSKASKRDGIVARCGLEETNAK